ncbi:PepSY domain-containing protein [Pseudomonas mangiferae]|uniref:Peptidase n=1 Tax=Pseudomonas mangiferae TaxID=2593654 RepID=A0A553GZS2_9PSED|nr:PepSY domain-containing protein [Pseudomonas mangiferae]TRX74990.1 peptidase [Pseudomonas mangiferae]
MSRRVCRSGLAAILAGLCTLATDARDLDQDEALKLRETGTIAPLDRLLQSALTRYPGATLLEAELEEEHGVYVYEVELLTREGVVRELELDAHDGRLLKDEED